MSLKPLFLFVHIPKTGGQTLRNHFIDHLQFHTEFIHLGPFGIEDAKQRGLPPFADREQAQRGRAKVILGHYVDHATHLQVPDAEPRYIAFLRDPGDRVVSLYNFTMEHEYRRLDKPVIPFALWWSERRHQTQVNWICRDFLQDQARHLSAQQSYDLALRTLENFWFVGTMQTFAADTAHLMEQMHLPPLDHDASSNVTGRDFEAALKDNQDIKAMIRRECELDTALYRHFLDKRMREIGGNDGA